MSMEDGERRFSRANRGSRMAVLLSEALDAQAGGAPPPSRAVPARPPAACALVRPQGPGTRRVFENTL